LSEKDKRNSRRQRRNSKEKKIFLNSYFRKEHPSMFFSKEKKLFSFSKAPLETFRSR